MSRHAHIDLPDGRKLDYEICPSAKARSLRLKMTVREGLTAIAPKGLGVRQVAELVTGKRDWIAAKLDQFEEVRHLLVDKPSARPEAFDLPALAESWRVEYRTTKGKTVGARTDQQGRILVYGAVTDDERCQGRPASLAGQARQGNIDTVAGVAGHREWLAFQPSHHQKPAHPLGQLLGRWRDQPERQAAVSAAEAGALCLDA